MKCWPLALSFVTAACFLSGCGAESRPPRPSTVETATKETRSNSRAAESVASSPSKAEHSRATPVADAPGAEPPADGAFFEPPRAAEPTSAPKPIALDEKPAEVKESAEDSLRTFRQKPQAGILTAGSLNDHQNLDDYRAYLSEAQQSSAGRNMPPFRLGERIVIEVTDSQGNGVSDVQITVTQLGDAADDNEGVLLDTTTRADGRTFFSTGLDAAGQADSFELTVRPPQGPAIIKQVSVAQSPWVVELPEVTRQLPQQLDLALVIDTTQSMADEINYLKVELDNIVSTVHRMFPNVEQRYALICYRDEGDDYVVRNVIDFTSSLPDFRVKLSEQSAKGGGDIPEAMHLALENANKLSWRHDNTARVLFLVADAEPHRPHLDRSLTAVRDLRQKGVALYPLAGSGVRDECEFVMRAAAFLTRGQYLFLTDHSGVGNPHAKPHAPKYEVEPLNQLMVRMIASELAGKPVLATDIIATEESDGSEQPPLPPEQNQSAAEHSEAHHSDPPQPPYHQAHVYRQPPCGPIWDSMYFRIAAAAILIIGILILDNRLKS